MVYLIPRELNKRKTTITCRRHPAIPSTDQMAKEQLLCSINLVTDTSQRKGKKNLTVTPVLSFLIDVDLDKYNSNQKGFEQYKVTINGLCTQREATCEGFLPQATGTTLTPDLLAQLTEALSKSRGSGQLQLREPTGGVVKDMEGVRSNKVSKASKSSTIVSPELMKQSTKKEIPTSSYFRPSETAKLDGEGSSAEVLKGAFGKKDNVLEKANEINSYDDCRSQFKIFGSEKRNVLTIHKEKEFGSLWIPSMLIHVQSPNPITKQECDGITKYENDLGYTFKTFWTTNDQGVPQCNIYPDNASSDVLNDVDRLYIEFDESSMPKINQDWQYEIIPQYTKGACIPFHYESGFYRLPDLKRFEMNEVNCNLLKMNLPSTHTVWDASRIEEPTPRQKQLTNLELEWKVRWNADTKQCESYDPTTNTLLSYKSKTIQEETPPPPSSTPVKMPSAPPSKPPTILPSAPPTKSPTGLPPPPPLTRPIGLAPPPP